MLSLWSGECAGDRRHLGFIAIIADAHPRFSAPVDPLQVFKKAVDEVDAELFAVANDIETGIFLFLQPFEGGAALTRR